MPAKAREVSAADAAKVLGIYESEVASVGKADEGLVATTTDGQRYLLTDGGGWEWLRQPKTAPQAPAVEAAD